MARRTNLIKLPRKRYKMDKALTPAPANVTITNVDVGSPNTRAVITFSGPVLLVGDRVPSSMVIDARTTLTFVSATANTLTLETGAVVTAADLWSIGDNDPAIRTQAGGFVTAANGTV